MQLSVVPRCLQERVEMVDFEGVELVDENQRFVMPQCNTYFLPYADPDQLGNLEAIDPSLLDEDGNASSEDLI